MLDLMRRKAQSTLIQITIGAIVLVFVFWGVGGNQGAGPNAVAVVNDASISLVEYQQAYDRILSQYREQFGGSIPPGLLETLGIEQRVINELIQRKLILQGGIDAGLWVSEQEVRDEIKKMEAFKGESGQFDPGWYKQLLAGNRMSVSDFEGSMKQDLLVSKTVDHVTSFAMISDVELDQRLQYEYTRKKFNYIIFDADKFRDKAEVTDEKLAQFYAENDQRYMTDPQIKLKYLTFNFAGEDTVEITDEMIEKYYQEHIDEFVEPEKRKAGHILIKTSDSDSEEVLAEKKEKAQRLLERVQKGESFADLARQNSEDRGSAMRGGDLGFFGRGQMVKPFEDAVFSMGEGGMTVVKSQFGYHVIRLEEIQSTQVRKLEDAKQTIVDRLKKEKAKDIAFLQANKAYEDIILTGSIEKYAKEQEVALKESDFFSRQQAPEELAGQPQILMTAFELNEGELSSLIEGRQGYAILYVADKKQPEVPELSAVKERVKNDFIVQESARLAREAAESMLSTLKQGNEFAGLAEQADLKVNESPSVSRAEKKAGGIPGNVVEHALVLTEKNPYPEEVVSSGRKFYVLGFKEAEGVAREVLDQKREEIKKQLQQETRANLLTAWVAYMRDNADITINEQFL